jgi:bZIP-type transcription factor MBZ1
MFEDNPLEPSPFVFDSHDFSTLAELDSFFNFNSSSSSSRQTSPAVPAIAEPQPDLNNLWFDFSNIQDDINSPKPVPSQSNADSPWDFFTFPHDSPSSGTTSTSGGLSPSFAIDPQLMTTPATSKAASDFGDDDSAKDEHGPEEEDDEDDEGPVTPPPVKPGNKAKDRKSVVHSGGVQKKVHISAVVKTDPFDNTLDDWRPTPEEYQKMSSKEKRQLRNKISARNFRNRRKGELIFLPLEL